jgi:NADH-quinone oxidoreductase subunit G
MGIIPQAGGMSREQTLAAPNLDVLWVVGANPLKNLSLASSNAFVVVQDLFMTETAQRADIVLPAASAYEKNGTVTNVCGEVQKLKQAVKVMGAKTDLEIFGMLAKEMKLNLDGPGPGARVQGAAGNVASAGDTLFTSGTLSRYSKILNSLMEAPGALYSGQEPGSRG